MKTTIIAIFVALTSLFSTRSRAQTVKYKLVYNKTTSLFEGRAVLTGSMASTPPYNISFTSQFSIVFPKSVPDVHLTLTTVSPADGASFWVNENDSYAPPALPNEDIHGLHILGGNRYKPTDVDANNEIVLFTFPYPGDCNQGVRIFENGVDPTSANLPSNPDYTQSFKMFPNVDIYNGNVSNALVSCRVAISGNVWDDGNGDKTKAGSEAYINGTNTGAGVLPGAPLYVNVADATGKVLATALVNSDGSYSVTGINTNQTGLQLQMTTIKGTIGNNLPAATLTTEWVYTGTNVGSGNNATQDALKPSIIKLNIGTADVITQDFGIELRPTALGSTTPTQNNNAPYTQAVPNTAFTGGDVDGTVQFIRITAFPSNAFTMVVNGIVYNAINFPAGGITIPASTTGNPLQSVAIKPNVGMSSVVIPFVTIDNAGVSSLNSNVIIPYFLLLPVSFGTFSATAKDCSVALAFETLTEENNSRFVVQHSTDGNTWQSIATLPSKGNSTNKQKYTYVHSSPVKSANYYRIQQIDIDGRFSYSVVAIAYSSCEGKVTVAAYPNPVLTILTVTGAKAGSLLQVIDASGKMVRQQAATTGYTRLEMGMLPPGTYLVKVVTSDGTSVVLKINK